MNADLFLTTQSFVGTNPQSPVNANKSTRRLFNRALRQGLNRRLWGKLSGQRTDLPLLSHQPVAQEGPRLRKVNYVPCEAIVGSESRNADFDNQFNPLKAHLVQRWIGIAMARLAGVELPPVELIQDGNEYYVRDGHHRISVAKMMGQLEIEAVIVN